MIYKNYLLVFFICITNISASKKIKETLQLTYDIYSEDDTERRQNIQDESLRQETFNNEESLDNSYISNFDLSNRNDLRNTETRFCLSERIEHKNITFDNGTVLCLEQNETYIVDKCLDKALNKPCSILPHTRTKCVQKYMTLKLRGFECDNPKQVKVVTFKIPSCCMCMLRSSSEMYGYMVPKQKKRNEGRINSFKNINCHERFGGLLCTQVKDYPEDVIANLNQNKAFEDLKMLFGTDNESIELSSRIGSEMKTMCDSRSRLVYPKAGFDKQGVEKYIVQYGKDGKDGSQGILASECMNPGKLCYSGSNFNSSCTQEYIIRKLVVLDIKTLKPSVNSIKIPSCCACHLTSKSAAIKGVHGSEK